jgi:hypothetical protein
MEWQQPNQPNSAIQGDFPYFPFYQSDPNQANYNYDDDNEPWDEDDDEGYPDQSAYYFAGQDMNTQGVLGVAGVDGAVSTHLSRHAELHQLHRHLPHL